MNSYSRSLLTLSLCFATATIFAAQKPGSNPKPQKGQPGFASFRELGKQFSLLQLQQPQQQKPQFQQLFQQLQQMIQQEQQQLQQLQQQLQQQPTAKCLVSDELQGMHKATTHPIKELSKQFLLLQYPEIFPTTTPYAGPVYHGKAVGMLVGLPHQEQCKITRNLEAEFDAVADDKDDEKKQEGGK